MCACVKLEKLCVHLLEGVYSVLLCVVGALKTISFELILHNGNSRFSPSYFNIRGLSEEPIVCISEYTSDSLHNRNFICKV